MKTSIPINGESSIDQIYTKMQSELEQQKFLDSSKFENGSHVCISPEQHIKELKRELFKSTIEERLKYLAEQAHKFGFSAISNIDWFIHKDIDRIFDEDNDANFYNSFANEVVTYVINNPTLLKSKARFVCGKLVYKQVSIKAYIFEHLQLDKDNELHKLFIKLIEQYIDYYTKQYGLIQNKTTEDTNELSEPEQYMKYLLLKEEPQALNFIFTTETIDDLLSSNMYHSEGVEKAKEILELTKIVVDHNDRLQDIEGLTMKADWKTIIYQYYDIPLPTPKPDVFIQVQSSSEKTLHNSVITDALKNKDMIGVQLNATHSKLTYHIPAKFLKQFARKRMDTFETYSFAFTDFIYSTLVTATAPTAFTALTQEQCVNIMIDTLALDTNDIQSKLTIELVKAIYDYFTEKETIKLVALKEQLLNTKDLEDTVSEISAICSHEINYHDIYKQPNYKYQLIGLVQIVLNNEQSLADIPDLTPTSDWKYQILNHYKLFDMNYPDDSYFITQPIEHDDTFDNDITDDSEYWQQFGPCKSGSALYDQIRAEQIKEGKSKGGKATKRNYTKSITIQNKETNEKHTFTMLGECMKFLNIPPATFSRFLIGKTKLNKKWEIIDIKTTKIN